jgi:hypothetical protein
VEFEIAGDIGALPWIGRKSGRSAASDFIRDTRRLIERIRFDVQDILAAENLAVILGELVSRINATGKMVESAFALILTVSGGEITRFQMLEDSFAVSRARDHSRSRRRHRRERYQSTRGREAEFTPR